MRLEAGRRLGLFEVVSSLGAGGMGEVYRARDTRLGREVALKVLPAEFAARSDRRARFEREARVLASFQHPGIAAIHGFEEADGVSFLVLELVEGKTLAQRLDRGALPVRDALELARQIAAVLEAAHEKGIIHRDLKPSNVMVLPDGRVKLLDFGLAKALDDDSGPATSQAPTASDPPTGVGVVMGTAPYMSPEQARGEGVDKRTDVWACGCVLFEMLSGRRAFRGGTTSEVVAAVLTAEPDWSALPEGMPASIRTLLRRCMARDPGRRLHDIADARIEIEEALAGPESSLPAAPSRRWGALSVAIAAILASLITAWAVVGLRRQEPKAPTTTRLVIQPEPPLSGDSYVPLAVSPDGSTLAYASDRLWVRTLEESTARPIGSDGAYDPFFSPDGQWIAYWAFRRLERVPITGGSAPIVLCPSQDLFGGSWSASGAIVFAPSDRSPLLSVPEDGGEPKPITKLASGELGHLWPEFLPGGDTLVFTAQTGVGPEDFRIVAQSLSTGERRVLIEGGTRARYASTGHLVYAKGNALYAVGLDVKRLRVVGRAIRVLDDVASGSKGNAQYAFGSEGTLFYVRQVQPVGRTLVWVSPLGQVEPLRAPPRLYRDPRLSPDGRRVALEIGDWIRAGLWVYDIGSDSLSRLAAGNASSPLWTRDGERLAFAHSPGSSITGSIDLYWQRADGSQPAELLVDRPAGLWPIAWWPDDRSLLFYEYAVGSRMRLQSIRPAIPEVVQPVTRGWSVEEATGVRWYGEMGARLSPNGRWLAYVSDESGGPPEVYVEPFDRAGARRQLTTEGGVEVVWSLDGREIFYRSGNKMMAIAVRAAGEFSAGKPRVLFEGNHLRFEGAPGIPNYDVSSDGRFLMIKPGEEELAPRMIQVVQGWFRELTRQAEASE